MFALIHGCIGAVCVHALGLVSPLLVRRWNNRMSVGCDAQSDLLGDLLGLFDLEGRSV
jgi:hypothetical protein